MRFTVNDKTYFVKWEYDRFYNDKYKYEEYTVCKIYDDTTSFNNPIVESKATKAEGDRFCKNTGRKISLDRALHKLFPDTLTMHGDLFPKEVRRIAWAEYFKESPKRFK